MKTMEQEMEAYYKQLAILMKSVELQFADAGVSIKNQGKMADNILVMDFDKKNYALALSVAKTIPVGDGKICRINTYDKPKRIAIIF